MMMTKLWICTRRAVAVRIGLTVLALAIGSPAAPSDAAAPATRPAGGLSFWLEEDPSKWPPTVGERITRAMTEAVAVYNLHSQIPQTVPATHNPGTPTADANFKGHIRFGGQIGTRTALHEISHFLGIGTAPKWRSLIQDGKWTGPHAQAQLRAIDGPAAVLRADRQHFWPYGLNFDKEGQSPEHYRRHVLMVVALRADLGLGPAPVIDAPSTPQW